MILWFALLVSHLFLDVTGSAAGLERITTCGTRCSQGLQCKIKPHSLFPRPCQNPTEGLNASSVFNNVSLSSVMRCEGRQKCSLHIRIKVKLQPTESIHGVTICTNTAGLMERCQNVSFRKASNERMAGLQVEIENDCSDISPSQQVRVTVKTVPSFCGITWSGTYKAPECISEDLNTHIPECITGRLSYAMNPQRKELTVSVSEMLEGHDYRLRLCRKDFICIGAGVHRLVKKEEPMRSVVLPYARPLPCLCIEGWSVVSDAPRVQVCPFRDRVEELWFGITFDPLEGSLSWKPACPVTAVVVGLCQKREDICVDLPEASQNVSRETITFSSVDPHPQLCVKFTAGSRSWTRCPFADAGLQVWEVAVTRGPGHEDVKMLSHVSATFSVGVCTMSESSDVCQVTETHTVHVEKRKAVSLNLAGERCNSCLQVTRMDVKFAPTVVQCLQPCSSQQEEPHPSSQLRTFSWDLTWVIVPAGVFLSVILIGTLVFRALLTVYRRRKPKINGCTSADPAFDCVVPAFQSSPVLHGGVLIHDSLHCLNTERTNLISD